jgi:hypothetical protein
MQWLRLIIDPSLRVGLIEGQLGHSIDLDGRVFTHRATPEEIVFYDWLADSGSAVCGLEIHLPPEHPVLRTSTPFSLLQHVEVDYFMRIWLSERRSCLPLGREAFGDIWFFEAQDARLAIVFGIDDWLSQGERDRLVGDLQAAQISALTGE